MSVFTQQLRNYNEIGIPLTCKELNEYEEKEIDFLNDLELDFLCCKYILNYRWIYNFSKRERLFVSDSYPIPWGICSDNTTPLAKDWNAYLPNYHGSDNDCSIFLYEYIRKSGFNVTIDIEYKKNKNSLDNFIVLMKIQNRSYIEKGCFLKSCLDNIFMRDILKDYLIKDNFVSVDNFRESINVDKYKLRSLMNNINIIYSSIDHKIYSKELMEIDNYLKYFEQIIER